MAFHHLAGVTTPGAPDEIDDWFATFQAWIAGTVGWTVESGAGTTDLRLSSPSEAGGLTMLFIHIWRPGGVGNLVRMEVSDDVIPTHETTEAGRVDSGGVQFAWWMSADLDALVICWKVAGGYNSLYAGLVMPFALAVPNETYRMIVTDDRMDMGSVLRRHDGVWDQDDFLYYHQRLSGPIIRDRNDNSLAISGRYFADNADIAGQLKHISGRLNAAGVNPEDTLTTGLAGATTEWVILEDSVGTDYAMRTGGVLPVGTPDGAHFAYATGVTATAVTFIDALRAHLIAIGWTATDYSPTSGWVSDWFFHSTGEDGTEDIYVRVFVANLIIPGNSINIQISDGIPGAHPTPPAGTAMGSITVGDFPTQYYIAADRDCICMTLNAGGEYSPCWAGKFKEFAPGLPDSTYKVAYVRAVSWNGWAQRIIHSHGGVWDQPISFDWNAEGVNADNSNPNNYDGTTYLTWPHILYEVVAGVNENLGQLPYFFRTHGGGIATLDTITVAGQVYTVFLYSAAHPEISWAMRSV